METYKDYSRDLRRRRSVYRKKARMAIGLLGAVLVMALFAVGCGKVSDYVAQANKEAGKKSGRDQEPDELPILMEKEKITLKVWVDQADYENTCQLVDVYKEEQKERAEWDIQVEAKPQDEIVKNVASHPQDAPDVFLFPSGEMGRLYQAGALQPITIHMDEVVSANGSSSAAVRGASKEGQMYAYPWGLMDASCLYYDTSLITDKQMSNLDVMLQLAAENDKKVAMDMASPWNGFDFFGGTGFQLETDPDGDGVQTDFNGMSKSEGMKGVDVLQAMVDLCREQSFQYLEKMLLNNWHHILCHRKAEIMKRQDLQLLPISLEEDLYSQVIVGME